jgi:hypothetical protein
VNGDKLAASLQVPSSAAPGVYDGFISLSDGSCESLVPVSVVVPIMGPGRYQDSGVSGPYDNYAVYGAFDWSWRYEAGDWRTYALIVPSGVQRINIRLIWTDVNTDIQAHVDGPTGFLIASSDYPTTANVGNGKFLFSSSTGGPEEDISPDSAGAGVYLLVLHNTLYGGNSFNYREAFTLDVNFVTGGS